MEYLFGDIEELLVGIRDSINGGYDITAEGA